MKLRIAQCTVVSLALAGIVLGAPATVGAAQPTIELRAPAQARVGEPIRLMLRVSGISSVAGYEAQLLFDRKAAHLVSVSHRGNWLDKLGWDVRDLGPVEITHGIAFGSYACPTRACAPRGPRSEVRGAGGNVLLATVEMRADRPGPLELRVTGVRVVGADGSYTRVTGADQIVTVRIAGVGSSKRLAPTARTSKPRTSPRRSVRDLTGDGRVDGQDVTQAALAWGLAREHEAVCRDSRQAADVNRDGCLDVADVEAVVAVVTGGSAAGARSQRPDGGGATSDALMSLEARIDALDAVNAPLTVNSTGDGADAAPGDGVCLTSSGTCTLRAAIAEANAQVGANAINFSIPGTGVRTIQLSTPLPTVSDTTGGTSIDGYTQPGAAVNTDARADNAQLKVEVRGTGPSGVDALTVTSSGNTIRGIAFYNLHRSIYFYGRNATGSGVYGCFIGTNAAGTFAHTTSGAAANGVSMYAGAGYNQVGDTALADRNVISGNARHGVVTYNAGSDHNVIYNNIIGLSPDGTRRLANLKHGIDLNADSSYNIIGGTGAGMRNVISGNGIPADPDYPAGVEISHGQAMTGNEVVGNYFGTDLTGNTAASWTWNSHYGIRIEDGAKNTLVSDNVIVNNRAGGLKIDAVGTSSTRVINNRVGITLNGQRGANSIFGINVSNSATNNRIGPSNIIANNPVGVWIRDADTDRNTITQNSIFGNDGLGIELDPYWAANPNDPGDVDTGPNEQLNYPEIGRATTSAVSGTACLGCTVDIFIADSNGPGTMPGPSVGAYGEGKTFVASAVADATGQFSVPISGVSEGQWLTATATDAAGNTSEFSENARAQTTAATPPGAPSLTSATGGAASVTLQWSPPASNGGSAVTNYNIYRRTSSGGEALLARIGNFTSYMDVDVVVGTTYWYRVSAVNAVGEGPLSNERSATAHGTGIIISDRFERTVASGFGSADIGGAWTVSSASRTKVANGEGVVYGWTGGNQDVQAWKDDVRQDMELLALVRLNATDPVGASYQPRVVARAQADARNGYSAKITHTPTGVASWALLRVANGGGSGTTTFATGTLLTSGAAGTSWWIRLQVDGTSIKVRFWRDGTSEPSTWNASVSDGYWTSGRPGLGVFLNGGISTPFPNIGFESFDAVDLHPSSQSTVPGAPSLTSAAAGNSSVSLQWTAPSSDGGSAITNYKIYRGTSSGAETFLTQVGNVTSFTDTTVANGTTYWYRVGAVNAVGEGPLSNELSATPTATNVIVSDQFERTVASGFGEADIGGAWSVNSTSKTKVENGEAVIYGWTAGGQDVQAWTPTVRTNMELLALVRLNVRDPVGANYQARVMARAQSDARNGYSARITHTPGGAANWGLSRIDNGGGTGSLALASGTLVSSGAAASRWWVRLRLEGTSIKVRYWRDGTVEPSTWNAAVTDSYWTSGRASFGVLVSPGISSPFPDTGFASFEAVDLG